MRGLRSLLIKRCIALGLLISLLPMLYMPLSEASAYNGSEHFVKWLRGQLKGYESEVVERAITIAQEKEAHNLHIFLEAFVEAYFEEQGPLDENVEIREVLSELLQRHWRQLISQGLMPYLSLKSLQARTSLLRDRVASMPFLLLKKQDVLPRSGAQSIASDSWVAPLFVTVLSTAVVPRGP